MKIEKFQLCILFFSIAILLIGCDLTKTAIMGRVYDAKTEEPLIGAVVETVDGNFSVKTDKRGWYRLEKLPFGDHNLQASYSGYKTSLDSAVLTESKYEFVRNFYLNPE